MRKMLLAAVCVLLLASLSGCVSQDDLGSPILPQTYGSLQASIEYTQGYFISVTNNEPWQWHNTLLVLNDTYFSNLWDLEPGEMVSFSMSAFSDGEGNTYDHLSNTCEKIVITCENPEGDVLEYVYLASTEGSGTMPPVVLSTPVLASDVYAAQERYAAERTTCLEAMQERLSTLTSLLDEQPTDYAAAQAAYDAYRQAAQDYDRAVRGYYRASIVLEHTTPSEGNLLALDKETIPFGSPDGRICTYGLLNMYGQEDNFRSEGIDRLIREGMEGQDVRDELFQAVEDYVAFLDGYLDMGIAYEYYTLNENMARQALYSDVLIPDCNPHCLYI